MVGNGMWHSISRGSLGLWIDTFQRNNIFFFFCIFLCSGVVCISPSEGPQSRAHMDSGSTTMYSLHRGTCSFTWLRCVPHEDTTRGKTWV